MLGQRLVRLLFVRHDGLGESRYTKLPRTFDMAVSRHALVLRCDSNSDVSQHVKLSHAIHRVTHKHQLLTSVCQHDVSWYNRGGGGNARNVAERPQVLDRCGTPTYDLLFADLIV
jgi:hypothetical protein